MNQQNPNFPVRRTVQRRGAGGQAGMSGARPQHSYQQSQQPYQATPAPSPVPSQPFPQQPYSQPGMTQAAPATLHEQKWADPTCTNATFGQRVGAYLIDAALITVAQFIIIAIFMGGAAKAGSDEAAGGIIIVGAIIMSVLSVAYKIGMEGAMGQTLGKKMLGLRLITTDGLPMGFGHAFKRNLNLFYALIPFIGAFAMLGSYVGRFFSVMNSPYNQGYHDRWGNTRLIKTF